MIDELINLASRKFSRKRMLAGERQHWWVLSRTLSSKKLRGEQLSRETQTQVALRCALLINGLTPQFMPISNRMTISEVRRKKMRPLPVPLHAMMVLGEPDHNVRAYAALLEGSWSPSLRASLRRPQ